MNNLTRRLVSASILSLPLITACHNRSDLNGADTQRWEKTVAAIEARRGGRIGVAARDLTTGRTVAHRGNERFAMCSTFKWILGGIVLSRAETGEDSLSRAVPISEADMVYYAPTTEPAIGSTLTVAQLCAATIGNSDNPAANILLRSMGGPDGFTNAVRAMGDEITRLDRYEPDLNLSESGELRDTSTPTAMMDLMQHMVFGDLLSPTSREILQGWMLGAVTGAGRLKAGLPEGWRLGHKTGTNVDAANNDVGFALPPPDTAKGPILIMSFSDGPNPLEDRADTAHADVARAVMDMLS